MIRLRRPSDDLLRRVLDDQRAKPFSYPSVGATRSGAAPSGYRTDRFDTDLGADEDDRFNRAGQALLRWVPQRGTGIRIFPDHPVAADQAFVLVLPLPLSGWAVAPARVAYLLDEPDRVGYAYGTLPAHPAQGEEAFIVVRSGGRVRFEVVAFSRPHDVLARVGKPVSRLLQVRTIKSYLLAMEAATA
ncbi:MAG: hypothetical protein QOE15_2002 [Acidimicrobiaceae bacterium]|nr:hypothetical protein [Acidimicrobiaceae bacterium]